MDLKTLSRSVRAELRGLSEKTAEFVGGHLLMAGRLVDEDPQAAHEHAKAARSLAPRLPIVREAMGETAYAAGDYRQALAEFRTIRRMSGTDEYVPAMADSERALGRHHEALKLIKQALPDANNIAQVVELRLVEAGVRADLGQNDEALRLLRAQIEEIGQRGAKQVRARLRYAYADRLLRSGDEEAAEQWFAAAATLDTDGTLDAVEWVAELQGVRIEVDEDDLLLDEDEGDETGQDAAEHGDVAQDEATQDEIGVTSAEPDEADQAADQISDNRLPTDEDKADE